jgi:hypothetical protein
MSCWGMTSETAARTSSRRDCQITSKTDWFLGFQGSIKRYKTSEIPWVRVTAEIKERKRAQKSQKGTYPRNEPHPNSNSDPAVLLWRELASNCSNEGVLRSLHPSILIAIYFYVFTSSSTWVCLFFKKFSSVFTSFLEGIHHPEFQQSSFCCHLLYTLLFHSGTNP